MRYFNAILLSLLLCTILAQNKGSLSEAQEIDKLLFSAKLQIDTVLTTDKSYEEFNSLLRTYLREPSTFYYRLDSLETRENYRYDGRVISYAAPDKSFKLWAYDDGGGSQRFYKNYIQYCKPDGSVDFEPFYFFGGEGEETMNESNPIIYEVHPFKYEGVYYYVLLMCKVNSGADVCDYLTVARFENGQPIYYSSFLPEEFQEQGYIMVENTRWNFAEYSFNPDKMELSYREYDRLDDNANFKDKLVKIQPYFMGDASLMVTSTNSPNGYSITVLKNGDVGIWHFQRGDSVNCYLALNQLPADLERELSDKSGSFNERFDIPVTKELAGDMFFMDINFDGEEEFIVSRMGYNRTYYACYDLVDGETDFYTGLLNPMLEPPYDQLIGGDCGTTTFDYEKKTIHISESIGSSCHIDIEVAFVDGVMKIIKIEESESSLNEDLIPVKRTQIHELQNDTLMVVIDITETL